MVNEEEIRLRHACQFCGIDCDDGRVIISQRNVTSKDEDARLRICSTCIRSQDKFLTEQLPKINPMAAARINMAQAS